MHGAAATCGASGIRGIGFASREYMDWAIIERNASLA
jgi:hypothetical protein